jgi:hypothetical protein
MKLTGYRGFNWESSGYHAGIPTSSVFTGTVQPNIIYRPGNTPVFGVGQISEMTIPAVFIYSGSSTYETAWADLMAKLRPLDTTPATLFGEMNDGQKIKTEAIMIVTPQYDEDVNTLTVQFVSVDGQFASVAPSTTTGTFTTTPTTSLRPSIAGSKPTAATVRVKPTTAATSGWTYRRRYTLTNALTFPITQYPWCLNLGDTSGLVTNSKALSTGDDVRVLISGVEVQRTLVDWNVSGTDSLCWVIIPSLPASGTLTVEVIYGNSAAGAPPTLAYPNLPAFDISTTGANRSTNAQWIYKVETVSANAGKGAWYINTTTVAPSLVNTSIPGAWRPEATFALTTVDDTLQPTFTDYTDTSTYYMGRFESTRAKYGTLADSEIGLADGVVLTNQLGITSVVASLNWLNEGETTGSATPVGKLVIAYRNATGQQWQPIYTNSTLYSTSTAITSATYTPAATVYQIAFAVWPYNSVGVPTSATAGQEATASWGSTLKVNIASNNITQTTAQAETAVYEMRTRLRLHRDGSSSAIAHDVKLGNYSAATGAGTPHLLVELNQQVEIDGSRRQAKIKNSANSATVETPASDTIAYVANLIDANYATTTGVSDSVLQLRPETTTYVTNPTFATNASDWTRYSATSGITASALARDTTTYDSSPAAGKMQITASTAGSGSSVVDVSSNYITLGSILNVSIGAAVRTDTANLIPRLVIHWYDGSQTFISESLQATWTPTANTWYRRVFAATKPETAIYARVGVATYTNAANQTGSTWIDSVSVLGNDIEIDDLGGGSLTVVADWYERYG